MTGFSEYLTQIITDNDYTIVQLAKASGVERTSIQHYLTGKNTPKSAETVHMLANALPLTPAERKGLVEAYEITVIGAFRYSQRTQVKRIIEALAETQVSTTANAEISASQFCTFAAENSAVIGRHAVDRLIKSVIDEAVSTGERSVDFCVSMDFRYFYSELFAHYQASPDIKIRQIMLFSKKINFSGGTNPTLNQLVYALPFVFAHGSGYMPYYCYSVAGVEPTSVMPYYILTSGGRLVLLSSDFTKAALISAPDIVELYRSNFNSMLEYSKPLCTQIKSLPSLLQMLDDEYIPLVEESGEQVYWIEAEPCVAYLATDEMVDARLNRDAPGRDVVCDMVCRHYNALRTIPNAKINVFTVEGINNLIRSGSTYTVPGDITVPLTREVIAELLTTLRQKALNGELEIHLTNPAKFSISSQTLLQVNNLGRTLLVQFGSSSVFSAVWITEETISDAFQDFAESLSENGLVHSQEESLRQIDAIIAKL